MIPAGVCQAFFRISNASSAFVHKPFKAENHRIFPRFVLQYPQVMQMKSSRLFQIVYRLLADGRTTAPVLAAELEVSVRTIYRDVEALCQAGVPIVTGQGQSGGIRLMDGWVLNKTLMNAKEQEQLLTAVQSLAALQDEGEGLALKLGALFHKQPSDWLRVDFRHWGPVNENDVRFEMIKSAVLEKRILQFDYAAYNGMSHRRAKPVLLYFKGSAWYLQAFCLMRNEFRTFKISRMSKLFLTDEHFTDELTPPPLEPWSGLFQWPEVRLRFKPNMAYRVYDEYDEECIRREEDGSLLVIANLPQDEEWLMGRMLSYGTDVEVLSPVSLHSLLAEHTLKLHQYYRKESKT